MPAELPICVVPVDASLREAVLQLRTGPDQDDFVSPISLTLTDAERSPGSTPMAILHGDAVVGYYRIEHSARTITGREGDATALGLRSLQVDELSQGQGVGGRALALLLEDMVARHPSARRVLLTVNARNAAALALYQRAGFVTGDALYHGGRSGPQYLLWRGLP